MPINNMLFMQKHGEFCRADCHQRNRCREAAFVFVRSFHLIPSVLQIRGNVYTFFSRFISPTSSPVLWFQARTANISQIFMPHNNRRVYQGSQKPHFDHQLYYSKSSEI